MYTNVNVNVDVIDQIRAAMPKQGVYPLGTVGWKVQGGPAVDEPLARPDRRGEKGVGKKELVAKRIRSG